MAFLLCMCVGYVSGVRQYRTFGSGAGRLYVACVLFFNVFSRVLTFYKFTTTLHFVVWMWYFYNYVLSVVRENQNFRLPF